MTSSTIYRSTLGSAQPSASTASGICSAIKPPPTVASTTIGNRFLTNSSETENSFVKCLQYIFVDKHHFLSLFMSLCIIMMFLFVVILLLPRRSNKAHKISLFSLYERRQSKWQTRGERDSSFVSCGGGVAQAKADWFNLRELSILRRRLLLPPHSVSSEIVLAQIINSFGAII